MYHLWACEMLHVLACLMAITGMFTDCHVTYSVLLQNVWDPRPTEFTQRHTLDNRPLTTYPSLCNPQGLTHYPSLSSQAVQGIWGSPARSRPSATLSGLEGEGSSEFMPGSLSSVAEDDAWAGHQMSTLQAMRSVDASMPYGSSPERVRLIQDDYHIQGSGRWAASLHLLLGSLRCCESPLLAQRHEVWLFLGAIPAYIMHTLHKADHTAPLCLFSMRSGHLASLHPCHFNSAKVIHAYHATTCFAVCLTWPLSKYVGVQVQQEQQSQEGAAVSTSRGHQSHT